MIAKAKPDILALQGLDWDHDQLALNALADALGQAGQAFPHRLALRPNTGLRTGLDHDGDGRIYGPRDAQGFGRYPGQGGMAILSRFPIDRAAVQDFTPLLWADLPGADLPRVDGHLFPSDDIYAVQRLSSVGHWDVPLVIGDTRLRLLTFHASPPVFDGPEDRNGRRNADEIRFWRLYLDGAIPGRTPPADQFVILGDANLDPVDGDGRRHGRQFLWSDDFP